MVDLLVLLCLGTKRINIYKFQNRVYSEPLQIFKMENLETIVNNR